MNARKSLERSNFSRRKPEFGEVKEDSLPLTKEGIFKRLERALVQLGSYPNNTNYGVWKSLLEKALKTKDLTKSVEGETLLHLAVLFRDKELAKALIDQGLDVNARTKMGLTPLHRASFYGYKDMVELLLEKGADPNAQTTKGNTPLHLIAPIVGKVDIGDALLKHGANPNLQNKDGHTPLHLALWEPTNDPSEAPMVELLLKHGVNPNIKDNNGNTPLHIATLYSNRGGIQLLLEYGANPNIRNKEGKTPLFYSLKDLSMMELLLKHGADPTIQDNNWNTVLDVVDKRTRVKIKELLKH